MRYATGYLIENSHAEPHIPCYVVQMLNVLMVRIIESELSGTRVYPTPDEVMRTGGDPQAGECVVDEQVYYY